MNCGAETAPASRKENIMGLIKAALGAAGGVEVIAAALALKNGIVPPTISLNNPDPSCDLNYTPNKAQKVDLTIAISESLGFGGHNSCIALRKI